MPVLGSPPPGRRVASTAPGHHHMADYGGALRKPAVITTLSDCDHLMTSHQHHR